MKNNLEPTKLSAHGRTRKATMLSALQDQVARLPTEKRRTQRLVQVRRLAIGTATIAFVGLITFSAIKSPADRTQKDIALNQANRFKSAVPVQPKTSRVTLANLRFAQIESNRDSVIEKYVVRTRPDTVRKLKFEPIAENSVSKQLREANSDLFIARIDSQLVVFNRLPQPKHISRSD